jgi:hypothetical protein
MAAQLSQVKHLAPPACYDMQQLVGNKKHACHGAHKWRMPLIQRMSVKEPLVGVDAFMTQTFAQGVGWTYSDCTQSSEPWMNALFERRTFCRTLCAHLSGFSADAG